MSLPDPAGAVTSGSGGELDSDEAWRLSPRQREILGLKADGYSNAEIAERLGISDSTVRFQVHRARLKRSADKSALGVANSDQVAGGSRTAGSQLTSGSSSRRSWPEGSFVGRLTDAERSALLAAGTPCRFEDGQLLLAQDDVGDFVYVVTSGLVKVIVATASGAETMLAIRSRGDLLGEFALLEEGPHPSTARAAGPVTVLRIDGAAFMAIVSSFPAVQTTVTRYVLSKLRASTERRAAERVWDARNRLAQVLYELGKSYVEPGSDGMIRIPISQGDLGELAGVAVSTAERVLKDLRRQGAVGTRYGEITIKNMAYLASIRYSDSP